MKDNVRNQGPSQILSLPRIQKGHVQHHNCNSSLFGQSGPLVQSFLVVPAQAVDALDNQHIPTLHGLYQLEINRAFKVLSGLFFHNNPVGRNAKLPHCNPLPVLTLSFGGYTNIEVDRLNLQKEVNALKEEINRIADSANFNGIKLLDGSQEQGGGTVTKSISLPDVGTPIGDKTVLKTAGTTAQGSEFSVQLDTLAVKGAQAGDTLDIEVGGDKFTLTLEAKDYTAADIANALKDAFDAGAKTIDGEAIAWNGDLDTTMNDFVDAYNLAGKDYTASWDTATSTLTLEANTAGAIAADPVTNVTGVTVSKDTAGADAVPATKTMDTTALNAAAYGTGDFTKAIQTGMSYTAAVPDAGPNPPAGNAGASTISGSYNAATTVIKQGADDVGGKSASTTIDLVTIFGGDINDGSTLTIGEKTYTFKWGDSCPRRLGRNPEPSGPPRRVLVDKDLRPAYYDDFRCLAEDCKISCCKGWNITFSKKDYLSLKRQEGSPDLNTRMDTGLRRIRKGRLADQFYGEFNMDSGVCPLLREDGLCQLQREKEHEALPRVCRTYPRAESYLISGCLERSLSPSCEGVLNLLWDLPEGIEFRSDALPRDQHKNVNLAADSPMPLWFSVVRNWCVDLLQNRRFSLPQRIWLMGLGLKELGETGIDHRMERAAVLPDTVDVSQVLSSGSQELCMYLSSCIHILSSIHMVDPNLHSVRGETMEALNLKAHADTGNLTIPFAPLSGGRKAVC